MSTLIEAYRLLDADQRRSALWLQLLAIGMAASTLVGVTAIIPFFSVLANPNLIDQHAWLKEVRLALGSPDDASFLTGLGVGFVLAVLLANVVNYGGSILMNRFAHSVGTSFGSALFADYLRSPDPVLRKNNRARRVGNILYEVPRVTDGILQAGLLLVSNAVTTVFIVVSIVVLSGVIAFAVVTALGASYAVVFVLARRRLRRNGIAQTEDLAMRARLVEESLSGAKEIVVLQKSDFFRGKFAVASTGIARVLESNWALMQGPRYLLEFLTAASVIGIALLASRTNVATPWLGQLSFVGFAAYRLMPALQAIFVAAMRIRAEQPAFENIACDLRQAKHNGRSRASDVTPWNDAPAELAFNNVSFAYQDQRFALHGLSLRIRSGSIVAIIGPNGAGKTTLIDLILGLLEPQSGIIEAAGVEQRTNRSAWQQRFSYVPQQITLIEGTIAENIALGVDAACIDVERMRRAARLAGFESIIDRLPKGLDEWVGAQGARLSGGQRQCLGIARALYREAPILVMDEATSALDEKTERSIIARLVERRGPKTVIMVTHSVRVLDYCSQVFELRNGTLVEVALRRAPKAYFVE